MSESPRSGDGVGGPSGAPSAPAADLLLPNLDNDVYSGDVHVHTGASFDVFTDGSKATPTDANGRIQIFVGILRDMRAGKGDVQLSDPALPRTGCVIWGVWCRRNEGKYGGSPSLCFRL